MVKQITKRITFVLLSYVPLNFVSDHLCFRITFCACTFKKSTKVIAHHASIFSVKGSSTPRLAGKFCKENREWMNDRIQVPVHYLNSE